MEDQNTHGHRKGLACGFSLLSSSQFKKVLRIVVPLVVVSGLISFLGPKTSSRELMSTYPSMWGNSSTTHSSGSFLNNNESFSYINPPKEDEVVLHAKEEGNNSMVVGLDGEAVEERIDALTNDSRLVNLSSPPPFAIETPHVQDSNVTETEGGGNSPNNGSEIAQLSNSEESNFSKNETIQIEDLNLKRVEAGLRKSRAAMKEAKMGNQTQDPDYVPQGPMYWNSKVFHRSYLEMEKRFKVFVYEEGEPPVFHNGPCKSIYSTEGNFIHMMEIHQFRTKDSKKAHVYFLPFSVVMMVRYVYNRNKRDFGPIRRTIVDYVNLIALKYPYWNRSRGADHFMLACHDWGPKASFSRPELGKNSIHALCNANTSERFNPMKDVSFPEINLRTGTIQGFIGGPSPSKRPILAFFAGALHGPIRPILLQHWENKDDDIKVTQYLPRGVSYIDMMKKSKFCLCPSGYEVASPRVVEAIYVGCVPVLISDHYVPPFSDVLNWKLFSVEVPVSDIPNLKKILTSISPRQYIRMQKRVLQIRRHFEVNSPPKRFDVFHMILHSVWLRRLNVKIHDKNGS